jgi:glycine/D-amino acid oxidase-like deaminating enzyme
MTECDTLIVGAGIVGLATAYHVKERNPEEDVRVIDRSGAAGQGTSAKSAGAWRRFFLSKTNFMLAESSTKFYEYLQKQLSVDLKMKQAGYLWLFDEGHFKRLSPALEEMRNMGSDFLFLEPSQLEETLKINTKVSQDAEAQALGLGDVHKGVFIPQAGFMDADSLVRFYESAFLNKGGRIQYNTNVLKIILEPETPLGMPGEPYFWQVKRVTGVQTDRGPIRAEKTIIAAGPWTQYLLDPLGVESHIRAKKRQVFSVKASTSALEELFHAEGFRDLLLTKGYSTDGCPFTISTDGTYFRPVPEEGSVLWLSHADDVGRPFGIDDSLEGEENYYNYGISQVIRKYFSQFNDVKPFTSFAGFYEINTLDGQPVIFEQNGLTVSGGASGSGLMKGDGIGRATAALNAGDEYAELFGGYKLKVADLGLEKRNVVRERLVI